VREQQSQEFQLLPPRRKNTAPRPKAKAPIQPKMKFKMAPKKIIIPPRAKANASIEPKKILQTPFKSTQVPSQPTRTSPRRAETAINMPHQQGTSFHSVQNNPFSKLKYMPAQMYPLSSSLLPAGGGSNVESDPSEFPSPHTRITFNRIGQLSHSRDTSNPHPRPDTVSRMKSAHPNPSRPSPPMSEASPPLLDTKLAAGTGLAAVATTHKHLELPFESIGLQTRQRSQASAQITMEPRNVAVIGNLASGIKRKRLAPPRKANKGATKKGATKKGATKKGTKDVVSKK
jgi:hypothetical protein